MKRVWILVQGADQNSDEFAKRINTFVESKEQANENICPSSHEFQFTCSTSGRQTCNITYYTIFNRVKSQSQQ